MKLQINTSGAWRNVADFDASDREGVVRAVGALSGLVKSKWCMLHDDGKREWIEPDKMDDWARWRPVTPIEPPPLEDVMVTVKNAPDSEPLTYMAFRRPDGGPGYRGGFFLSGADEERITGVFAWAPCMPAAPASMGRAAA